MTYREKRERRAERREEWAAKRSTKQASAFDGAQRLASAIPMGQPILVGHHSEGRARRDAERIQNGMFRGVEHGKMAAHHATAADTIRRQLDTSIYSDDNDAIERLEEKLSGLEAQRARFKAVNVWIRKNRKAAGLDRGLSWQSCREAEPNAKWKNLMTAAAAALDLSAREVADMGAAWEMSGHVGYPSYHGSNLSGNISRLRKRLEEAREGGR